MTLRALLLATILCVVPVSVSAQGFQSSDPAENPAETASGSTFEFSVVTNVDRVRMGESFTLEISLLQKWGESLGTLSLDIPWLENFSQIGEQRSQKDYIDFRGVKTYDTVYLLKLSPLREWDFIIGPITLSEEWSGQHMEAPSLAISVQPAITSSTDTTAAAEKNDKKLPAAPQRNRLSLLVIVFGTLSVLLVAFFIALVLVSDKSKKTKQPAIESAPESIRLPATIHSEQALFELLAKRYSRDVRSLTTREIAALETDPDERTRVTELLDSVRLSRYS